MHDDGAWTIDDGSDLSLMGSNFFILTKRFFVPTDISDPLHLSLSLVSVHRLATSKIVIFCVTLIVSVVVIDRCFFNRTLKPFFIVVYL
jgi:hypothetical protein